MSSLLESSPGNKFGVIKQQSAEAEKKGIKLVKPSIGEPNFSAHKIAREAAAAAILSDNPAMHGYQDNDTAGCPNFAPRFVQAHPGNQILKDFDTLLSYLPIPGIKPIIEYVIASLGAWEKPEKTRKVLTTPGYPTPSWQALKSMNVVQKTLPSFSAEQGFLPTMEQIDEFDLGEGDMIMLNLPNNPSGAVADRDWWEELCLYCEMRGIYIFNDAAYAVLKYDSNIPNLAEVAVNFPRLNWSEAYSASKAGNFCGWRVGAIVGSKDHVADIAKIKGNSDSGLNAALACGIIELFENHYDEIEKIAQLYKKRLNIFNDILARCGFKQAIEPKATFFSLFHTPETAFGKKIEDTEEFNDLMINSLGDNIGVVGVPFDECGEGNYIRYAVCAYPVEENVDLLEDLFGRAKANASLPAKA